MLMSNSYAFPATLIFLLSFIMLPGQCPIDVNAGDDIYLCAPPQPTQLNGQISAGYLNFVWSPTTGLVPPNVLDPTVNVSGNISYVLTGRAVDLSSNLITNGDFESGNSGFTSDYIYSPGDLWPEGVYDVLTNPQDDHPNFSPCGDHTSGTGNMMVINGAGTPNTDVWCQTIPIVPNSLYVFSAWVATVVSSSPAQLQFSINGSTIGSIFSAPSSTCVWQNFYNTWNSGSNTSAQICIVNQNTAVSGNDFALDDIFFSQVCEVKDTVKIEIVSVTAVATPTIYTLPCEGATLTLSGTGSSFGPGVSYLWETDDGNIVSGATTLAPVIDAPGSYTLTVSYDNGSVVCTKTATVNVILSPSPLNCWITPPGNLGCQNVQLTLLGNSSQGNVSYQWTPSNGGNIVSGQTNKNCVINAGGTYTLLVTNLATGCTATSEVTVTSNGTPPISNTSAGQIDCQNLTTFLSGDGSSEGVDISYIWSAYGGGQLQGSAYGLNAVAAAAGYYVLMVMNSSNGCTTRDTVQVTANLVQPTTNIANPGVFDCDSDSLSLTGSVAPPSATYSWSASAGGSFVSATNTLTPLAGTPGTYSLIATNPVNGCKDTSSITINGNFTTPTVSLQPADSITCQQNQVILTSNGSSIGANFQYNWTASGGGNIVSGSQSPSPTVNAAGIYTLLISNSTNGCTGTASIPVVADVNAVVAVANGGEITCNNSTTTLNANGSTTGASISYFWSTTNGSISGPVDQATAIASTPGTYQLLITNTANGCTAVDLFDVLSNTTGPMISIAPPAQLTCTQLQIPINASGTATGTGITYLWSTADGNIVSGGTTLMPIVSAPGTYTLTVQNSANGCSSAASTTVTTDNNTPIAVINPPATLSCVTQQMNLFTTGSSTGSNFNYSWTGPGIVSGINSESPVINLPGTYALTITFTANQCTATASITVLENITPPSVDAGNGGILNCNQLTWPLNGSGQTGATASWVSPNGNITGAVNAPVSACDAPGTYYLTMTDPTNGCSQVDSVIITENIQAPMVAINPPFLITCATPEVTLTANAIGFSPNFNFSWTTATGNILSGDQTATPLVSAAGVYTVLVTDPLNGCTQTSQITVNQDAQFPVANAGAPQLLTCAVLQTSLLGTADTGPGISYLWTSDDGGTIISGNTTLNPTVNAPGTYDLTVVNANTGCSTIVSTVVTENTTPPVSNAGTPLTLTCGLSSVTLDGSMSSQGNHTYLWSTLNGNILSGSTTLAPVVNAAGTYDLVVTDQSNGCTHISSVQVLQDANAPVANAGPTSTITCAVPSVVLQGSASQGAGINYSWSASGGGNILSGGNTLTPTVNAPGMYLLSVNNTLNGCQSLSSVTINADVAPPILDAGPPKILTCAVQQIALTGSANGSQGHSVSIQWSSANGSFVSGQNTAMPIVNATGTYSIQVTDQINGCMGTDNVQVTIDTVAPIFAIAPPATLTCSNTTVPISATVAQPVIYALEWNILTPGGNLTPGSDNLHVNTTEPGTYQLIITGTGNGCTEEAQVSVLQDIAKPIAVAASQDLINCTVNQVPLDGSGSSTGTNFQYTWAPAGSVISGGNTLMPTVNSAATYTLTVLNTTNGCTQTTTTSVGSDLQLPGITVSNPADLTCVQTTVDIQATTDIAAPIILWTTADGNIVSGAQTLTPTFGAAGTYTITLENPTNGCSALVSVDVNQNTTPPTASVLPTEPLHCNHAVAQLSASSGMGATFQWSTVDGNILNGQNTATPMVDAAGTYNVTVTDPNNGCTATKTASLQAIPDPDFNVDLVQPDCHTATGSIEFTQVSGGQGPFEFSFDGGQNYSALDTFSSANPGSYNLVIQDQNGCTATETAVVEAPFQAEITIEDLLVLDFSDSIQLTPLTNIPPGGGAIWEWSTQPGLSCYDCANPFAQPFTQTTYNVTVTDANGCSATDRITVQVKRDRNVYIPNVFSPNDDGQNDRFYVFGKGIKKIRSMQVFSRWGEKVFSAADIPANEESFGWDGLFNGKRMNPAVFAWFAEIEFVDGKVILYKGDVTLL